MMAPAKYFIRPRLGWVGRNNLGGMQRNRAYESLKTLETNET